jgi:hypothetical protein
LPGPENRSRPLDGGDAARQTGNPKGGSLSEWHRYEPATARHLEFSADGPVTNANIRPAHRGIFLEWVRQHMQVPR